MKVKRLFLFVFFMNLLTFVYAQMTDEQIVNMIQDARRQGKGQQEILLMLTQKGVTQEQLIRVKNKYEKSASVSQATSDEIDRMRVVEKKSFEEKNSFLDSLSQAMAVKKTERKVIFGHDIFNNDLLTFEPNLNIATPEDYVLGPGDEVIIDIWGDAEQTFRQKISPEGFVMDSRIGPIYLNGLSVKEANERLKNAFGKIYATIGGANPTTFLSLSLGEIRSIRVNVMGEVEMPGTYTLPSLASLFHAIYSAGGVNEIGSLRTVKINRGGKELAEIDVYDYLLKGKTDLDIRLQEGDVIVVPPYRNLVTLKGKVKRPLIYEMKEDEKIDQLLDYAGGFTGDAYKKALRVIRKSGREYQVYNVENIDFGQFDLADGDEVTVDAIINRFENRVEIRGAVYRAGLYDLGNVGTVKELIEKAEGVRGDAFLNRAVMHREKPDFTQEVLAVDIKGLLNGSLPDIELRNNDVLYIPSIFDLQEEYTVKIMGAVRIPGDYRFAEGMSIEDLIIQAGGLKESASFIKIDVARRIRNAQSSSSSSLAENYTLTLKDGFIVDGKPDFVLQPFDEVIVRDAPGYQKQQAVQVLGEVNFGGEYVLSQKGERLSDLIKKAGGLTPEAYTIGARLIRKMNDDERAQVRSVLKLAQQSTTDSISEEQLNFGDEYYVGIQLDKALQNPGSVYDVVLREGDVLKVPEYSGIVKISGAVLYPNSVVYNGKNKLKHYVAQGGGFSDLAKKRKVFVVYMNGTVAQNKFFSKAKVAPGCEIIVPTKPKRQGIGLAEVMSIASSTTSMAALVTSIINSTK